VTVSKAKSPSSQVRFHIHPPPISSHPFPSLVYSQLHYTPAKRFLSPPLQEPLKHPPIHPPLPNPTRKLTSTTGGGSGFGEGIAHRFASEGCKVLISDINSAGGERVAATDPQAIHFVKADVTSAADWKMLVDSAVREFGAVDILVNNAGTSYPNKVHTSPPLPSPRLSSLLSSVSLTCDKPSFFS